MISPRTALATAVALGAAGLIGTAAPAGAAPAPSPKAAACDKAPGEAQVQGRPTGLGPGSPGGDYLWHDAKGFHLRVTHAAHDRRVYTGVIHSSARLRVEPVRLEKGDRVLISLNRRTILFRFTNHGYIDGIDLHTDCASSVTVSRLHVGRHRLPTSHVYLGKDKAHPAKIPFTVHRMPAASSG